MSIPVVWIRNLDKESKTKFLDNYKYHVDNMVIVRLREIISENFDATLNKLMNDSLDTPGFAERQAARLGEMKAYKAILDLFEWKE